MEKLDFKPASETVENMAVQAYEELNKILAVIKPSLLSGLVSLIANCLEHLNKEVLMNLSIKNDIQIINSGREVTVENFKEIKNDY